MIHMKIGMVVFEKFTDLDFYLPWDLLNRVKLLKLHDDWTVEILSNSPSVTSATGLKLASTKPLNFANECDAVFFCSGYETRQLISDKSFLESFKLDETRQIIAAIDSGALILGALGLLKGRKATTYPTAFDLLSTYCTVVHEPFVEDGSIATGARCMSGDRIALWMIEKLIGKAIAAKVHEAVRPLP
jgi:transcriptional regulator GlxA family with amidase domain